MPRRKAPPRLYLDRKRNAYVIRDGARFIRTGCVASDTSGAEAALATYIGEKYAPPQTNNPTVIEVLVAYANEVLPHRASRRNITYCIGSLSKWWTGKLATDVKSATCQAYSSTKTSSAALADLKVLRAALRHWQKERGPLATQPVIWTPSTGEPRERWLTRTEAARLLKSAGRTQHLRRFVLLGIYTGSRPGNILSLTWDQIDIAAGVMHRNPPGKAVQGNKRAPPVRLGRRILSHLRRWARLDKGQVAYLCHYEGRRVADPHTTWRRAVKASGLKGRITPHIFRRTRATWLMQAGVSIWEAAGHLGMNPKTLTTVYAQHSPDWQKNAAEV